MGLAAPASIPTDALTVQHREVDIAVAEGALKAAPSTGWCGKPWVQIQQVESHVQP